MSTDFNRKDQKQVRQRLRNAMTSAEQRLWYALRRSQLRGYKFRRQQGIGPYVVDFYCPVARLVVEADGDSHYRDGAPHSDMVRQRWIESQGLRVIRFTNAEVMQNIDGVLMIIERRLATMPTPSHSPLERGRKV